MSQKPRVDVSITCHPSRKLMVDNLVDQLDLEDRDLRYHWDDIGEGTWAAVRRLLTERVRVSPDLTHHLVLEDDVVVCRDLLAGAEELLRHVSPDVPVSLFASEDWTRLIANWPEKDQSSRWVMRRYTTGQALLIPVEMVDSWIRWADENVKAGAPGADVRLSTYCVYNDIDLLHVLPSLVQHVGVGMSVVPREWRRDDRVSAGYSPTFPGVDVSALDYDWSVGSADPVVVRAPTRSAYKGIIDPTLHRER